MVSTTSMIIFGIIVLIAVIIIWKWWNRSTSHKKTDNITDKITDMKLNDILEEEEERQPLIDNSVITTPMVFVVNDNGNLDLTDMTGKLLNIGFGKNPKTYAILLDYAENDIDKNEQDDGSVTYISKVGTTKHYEILDQSYIINYTRL